jgi:hypothetical protein
MPAAMTSLHVAQVVTHIKAAGRLDCTPMRRAASSQRVPDAVSRGAWCRHKSPRRHESSTPTQHASAARQIANRLVRDDAPRYGLARHRAHASSSPHLIEQRGCQLGQAAARIGPGTHRAMRNEIWRHPGTTPKRNLRPSRERQIRPSARKAARKAQLGQAARQRRISLAAPARVRARCRRRCRPGRTAQLGSNSVLKVERPSQWAYGRPA